MPAPPRAGLPAAPAAPQPSASPQPARLAGPGAGSPSVDPAARPAASATPQPLAAGTAAVSPRTAFWLPPLNTSWQIQFVNTLDLTVDAALYEIDGFDASANTVGALHAAGRRAVCYVNAGAWEDYRSDAAQFPAAVLGKAYSGFPNERWLDIRRIDLLGPLMLARLDMCRSKGFDGVDPDNVNGFENDTGFPLTSADQLAYNIFLANAAHARGLSIGLKNDLAQVGDLWPYFDYAFNEECFQLSECGLLAPFLNAGKPVFNIEYNLQTSQFCPQANAMNVNAIVKRLELDAFRVACRPTAPTPTATPLPACNPRPRVGVTVTRTAPGRVQATISQTAPNVSLQSVQFGAASNALLDVAGRVGVSGGFMLPLANGSQQLSFTLRPATPGTAVTVPLVVSDGCGDWPTLVGGGPSAF